MLAWAWLDVAGISWIIIFFVGDLGAFWVTSAPSNSSSGSHCATSLALRSCTAACCCYFNYCR
ncbi:hypothetical protein PYCCODRAFT_26004 [Trametes coccinea BRFM310]|uniref:Uncharacterized protein n=1 Tax=Trametes coccinea (strain BRFM310) TaxID=1353009 RepID=A0A1Y2J6S4_TRAC3|nr:hypothetical protein PYCCODRAFT_26004 [Trametes coccinea BRFM310]